MATAIRQRLVSDCAGILQALYDLSRDSGTRLDDLFDQALRDLLKKHRRPASLKDALLQSTRSIPANDREPSRPRKKRRINPGFGTIPSPVG